MVFGRLLRIQSRVDETACGPWTSRRVFRISRGQKETKRTAWRGRPVFIINNNTSRSAHTSPAYSALSVVRSVAPGRTRVRACWLVLRCAVGCFYSTRKTPSFLSPYFGELINCSTTTKKKPILARHWQLWTFWSFWLVTEGAETHHTFWSFWAIDRQ